MCLQQPASLAYLQNINRVLLQTAYLVPVEVTLLSQISELDITASVLAEEAGSTFLNASAVFAPGEGTTTLG